MRETIVCTDVCSNVTVTVMRITLWSPKAESILPNQGQCQPDKTNGTGGEGRLLA